MCNLASIALAKVVAFNLNRMINANTLFQRRADRICIIAQSALAFRVLLMPLWSCEFLSTPLKLVYSISRHSRLSIMLQLRLGMRVALHRRDSCSMTCGCYARRCGPGVL